MNWVIFAIILVIVGVAAAILYNKNYSFDAWGIIATIVFAAAGIILLFSITCTIRDKKDAAVFERQQEYSETHQVVDPVENAALTNQKIELNEWLYEAQYYKTKWGGWSFYPDEVLELTPIN